MGSGGIAPRILNFCTRRRYVVSFILRVLYSFPDNIICDTFNFSL